VGQHLGHGQCQARLARAARAGEGDQPGVLQERLQLGQLLFPADEARHWQRQGSGQGVWRQQWREVIGQFRGDQLEDLLRLPQVTQVLLAAGRLVACGANGATRRSEFHSDTGRPGEYCR